MRVLMVTASRHGSTAGIAAEIGARLRDHGIAVDAFEPADAPQPAGYDAVILGSAIYMGNWLGEAREYIDTYREDLTSIPLWIFSSGPLGEEQLLPEDDPARLVEALGVPFAREHRIFAGRLDRAELGVGERLVTRMVKAPVGDFRDWKVIADWAHAIAADLRAAETARAVGAGD